MANSSQGLKKILPDKKSHAPSVLIIEIIIGLLLSLGSFLGFIFIAEEVLEEEGVFLDATLSIAVYAFRSPVLTDLMYGISFLGGGFLLFSAIFLCIFLFLKNFKREAFIFFILVLGGHIITAFLKALLKIPRPTIDPLYIEQLYSFPSGHSMNSLIFYGGLAYLAYHLTRKRLLSLLLSIVAAILIFLIGFSRIYLGVHFPSDVIAGFIAGLWWLATVILIDKTLTFYRLGRLK